MPAAQSYQADPRILDLGDAFYDAVEPASFPACTPRFLNRRWAGRVGLGELGDEQWAAHFCRFEPLAANLSKPLALRYHGHQFRVYNPDIGDGRGFTFAQLRDDRERLLDLGTKGSGQTPHSRTADGRLTLKGGVREVLATEMLEALGVNTSKTFALFETGEELVRGDEPSPTRSSVLTRLSHGHIRIGTFQRLAFYGEVENIEALVRYCLTQLYGEKATGDAKENVPRFFDLVATATAGLAASYMAAGFVHGVLNSDNINVTGESFDYGPWRFTPDWDAGLHRGLFRPLRTLFFRAPAGGNSLGPRPVGRCPLVDRRSATVVGNSGELVGPVREGVGENASASARCLGARWEPGPRPRGGTAQGPSVQRANNRSHLLRLARRSRPGSGALPFRTVSNARRSIEGTQRVATSCLLVGCGALLDAH